MVQFRRNYVPGGTCFFTVTLDDRRSRMLTDNIGLLRDVFRTTCPFDLLAIVVLLEHLHTVIQLPDGDADYSGSWRSIKSQFSHGLVKNGVPLAQNRRSEYRLWRRRFWEHTIRDEHDLATHIEYIHYNPVKRGWVTRGVDWPWSSFHRYVRWGQVDVD